MFATMTTERERIIASIIQLVYFMRGSVQYRDMLDMTAFERNSISEFIEKRLEIEVKKMYPQY
jgi:hypothetical protein